MKKNTNQRGQFKMLFCHESDIENIRYMLKSVKLKEKSIISFDFDDTLYNHISTKPIKTKRNFFLRLIKNCNCLNIYPIIVSSRNEKLWEISDFCQKHDIKDNIEFVIHSVKHKPTILKMIESDIHFDDDIKVLAELYDYGLMGFLSSEWSNQKFYVDWLKLLNEMDHLQYFKTEHLKRKERLSTIV